MRNLLLLFAMLTSIAEAHADSDDDIFSIINKSSQRICIKAASEEKDIPNDLSSEWMLQGEVDAGQKRIFKWRDLEDIFRNEKVKLIKITKLKITLKNSLEKKEYIFKLQRNPKNLIVITDPFLQHLGLFN